MKFNLQLSVGEQPFQMRISSHLRELQPLCRWAEGLSYAQTELYNSPSHHRVEGMGQLSPANVKKEQINGGRTYN